MNSNHKNETSDMEKNDIGKPKIRMDKKYRLEKRKNELFDKLSSVKLQYKKNGICDAYIKFGKPSIDEVIAHLRVKSDEQTDRLIELSNILVARGMKYDNRIETFNYYVRNGGNLKDVMKKGEIEYWYWNCTDYPELKDSYNDEIAKNISLNKYIKENGEDKYTRKIIKKELSIRIY